MITSNINFSLIKGASTNDGIQVYQLKKSILPYKKGFPYWWYTGIQRLQSIQNSILENFKHQFYLTKRGFHSDGIKVYEDYRVYKI